MTPHDSPMNTVVEEVLRFTASRPALLDGTTDAALGFDALARRAGEAGAGLAQRGLRAGDVLALWAPNGPDWVTAALGAMAVGAAVAPIGPLATPDEARRALALTDATLLVAAPPLARAARSAGLEAVDLDASLPAHGALLDAERIDPGSPALLPLSSGTTGLPKAVVLTHANVVAALRQIRNRVAFGERDRMLAVAPFAHVMGSLLSLFAPLSAGATVITMPRFDPGLFLTLIERHGVTATAAPPPVARLLATDPRTDEHDLSSLELFACGGAPLDPSVQEAFCRRLPDVAIGQGYGMTETAAVISMPDGRATTRPGVVGVVASGTELRIDRGELLVRGPQVMAGYLGGTGEDVFTGDGWLRTGDLAEIEPDGQLRIVGRAKDLIKVNGFQVSPAELESVLLGHPCVADAAVIGVPHAERGEVPVAFVVAGGELDSGEVAAWFSERVAPYKRLHSVEMVDGLPRNPAGKLLRRELREAWSVPA